MAFLLSVAVDDNTECAVSVQQPSGDLVLVASISADSIGPTFKIFSPVVKEGNTTDLTEFEIRISAYELLLDTLIQEEITLVNANMTSFRKSLEGATFLMQPNATGEMKVVVRAGAASDTLGNTNFEAVWTSNFQPVVITRGGDNNRDSVFPAWLMIILIIFLVLAACGIGGLLWRKETKRRQTVGPSPNAGKIYGQTRPDQIRRDQTRI